MDPVFTLQWPEFLLAERLQKLFPKSKHFSVLVPTSRQEKGIDLALVHKRPGGSSRVALLQVKASRTHSPKPPKGEATRCFRFETWFNTFEPSDHADFFLLLGMYAPDSARTKRVGPRWYRDVTLLFTYAEMKDFIDGCLTVREKKSRKRCSALASMMSLKLFRHAATRTASTSPSRSTCLSTSSKC